MHFQGRLTCYSPLFSSTFKLTENLTGQSLTRLPCPSSNGHIENMSKAIAAAKSLKWLWTDVDGVEVLPSPEMKKYLRRVRNRALEPCRPLRLGESSAATRWRRRRRAGGLFDDEVVSYI